MIVQIKHHIFNLVGLLPFYNHKKFFCIKITWRELFMKYIANTWSHKMFIEPHLVFKRWKMTENEFRRELKGGYPCIGAPDIANKFDLEVSKEPIKARSGDVLLNAICNNGKLEYYYVTVTENTEDKPFESDDVEEVLF